MYNFSLLTHYLQHAFPFSRENLGARIERAPEKVLIVVLSVQVHPSQREDSERQRQQLIMSELEEQ